MFERTTAAPALPLAVPAASITRADVSACAHGVSQLVPVTAAGRVALLPQQVGSVLVDGGHDQVIAVLVGAVQELQQRVDKLEGDRNAMEVST